MYRDICRWRLAGQFLTTEGAASPADLVRTLGAVQAQDYAGAKWALAQRLRDATEATVEREIDAGRVLRTHVLRPTWHFVAAEDIRWMLALTGPRVSAAMGPMNRRLELERAIFRKSHAVLEKALSDGRNLTRAELRAALERAGLAPGTGQRLGHLVMQAELDGVLCSGPRRGKQFTYALLEERVPVTRKLTNDEALRELTRRYFATRAPASAHDFAWWSGLTVAQAKRGIEMLGAELERVTVADVPYWRGADRRPARRASSAHLLPNYDEYFIGYRDRRAIGVRLGSTSPVMVTSALVPHVIVVDGQLVGTWKRTLTGAGVTVTLRYLTRVTEPERRRVVKAARAFGDYLERPLELIEEG